MSHTATVRRGRYIFCILNFIRETARRNQLTEIRHLAAPLFRVVNRNDDQGRGKEQ